MAAPTSRLASRVVALLALCICTDSLHAQWGNIEAEWKLEDASVGWTLTGAKGTAILGSVVVPVQCVGPTDARLYWSVPSNWNDVLVPFRLYEKYSDYVTNPGSVEVWTVDCGEKTVQMFFEDLTPNLGPTETDLTAHIPLHEFGIPAYAGMGIRLKYDVTIDGNHLVFLDQEAVLESLLIGANATLEISDSHTLTVKNPILNMGTFRKSTGTGDSSISSPFNNWGRIEVLSGTLSLAGGGSSTDGTFHFANGGRVRLAQNTYTFDGLHTGTGDGALEIAGSYTNVAFLVVPDGHTLILDFTGGSQFEMTSEYSYLWGGSVVNTGSFRWAGGQIGLAGGLTNNSGDFQIVNGGIKWIRAGVLSNAGTVTQAADQYVGMESSTRIENLPGALYEVQGDGDGAFALRSYSSTGPATFNNGGTFRKSGGTGTTTFTEQVNFNNTGTVEVQSGTLSLAGGGSSTDGNFVLGNGARLSFFKNSYSLMGNQTVTGDGTFEVAGANGPYNYLGGSVSVGGDDPATASVLTVTSNLLVAYDSSLYTKAGGTVILNARGEHQAVLDSGSWGGGIGGPGSVINNGNFRWASGRINGPGGLTNTSDAFEIVGPVYMGYGGVLTNRGTIRQVGGAYVQFLDAGRIDNEVGALYDIQGDGNGAFVASYSSGPATFNNRGTFRKSGGTGTTTLTEQVNFNNIGTVEVQSGTLMFQGGYKQTKGATMLTGGTLMSGSSLDIQGGDIGGSGTIISDLLNAGGRVLPGTSIGHLIVAGDYTQGKDAKLLIELAGTALGEFDVLEVAGYATLDGTLGLTFLDGFRPQLEDTFEILTYGPRSGEFGVIEVLGFPGYEFVPLYGQTSMTLVTQAVPEPATLGLLTVGMGLLLGRRRSRVACRR
jgi:hypothetical protein